MTPSGFYGCSNDFMHLLPAFRFYFYYFLNYNFVFSFGDKVMILGAKSHFQHVNIVAGGSMFASYIFYQPRLLISRNGTVVVIDANYIVKPAIV